MDHEQKSRMHRLRSSEQNLKPADLFEKMKLHYKQNATYLYHPVSESLCNMPPFLNTITRISPNLPYYPNQPATVVANVNNRLYLLRLFVLQISKKFLPAQKNRRSKSTKMEFISNCLKVNGLYNDANIRP